MLAGAWASQPHHILVVCWHMWTGGLLLQYACVHLQVMLPASFLSRVLPALSTSLESLALLHVCGTQPEDMASLEELTAVTSLRLIPSDHDVGGLEPLLAMKHLKKLSIK